MTLTATLLAIGAVLAAFAGLLFGLKGAEKWGRFHPEALRKGVHVGMGLVVLPFPWIFDHVWPVIVLAALACSALLATRSIRWLRRGVGTVMDGVGRDSLGEIYYPISVVLLFILSGDHWLLYVVPILMLALADAVAALVGIRYGQVQYQTADGVKSLEGSLAFFLVAFFSAHLPILLLTNTGRAESILIAAILALLVMMLESVAWRGLDNLFIPLGAHAFLRLYLGEDVQSLVIHLLVAAVFMAFALAWRGRSKLDDSALIGCALFAYTTVTLGGWLWFLGPAVFFFTQILFRTRSTDRRPHTVFSMFWATAAGLVWLFIHSIAGAGWLVILFTSTFAAQITLYGVSRIRLQPDRRRRPLHLFGSIGIGWLVVHCPILLIASDSGFGDASAAGPDAHSLLADLGLGLLALVLVAFIFYRVAPRIYGPPLRATAINPTFAALCMLASLVAGLQWLI